MNQSLGLESGFLVTPCPKQEISPSEQLLRMGQAGWSKLSP